MRPSGGPALLISNNPYRIASVATPTYTTNIGYPVNNGSATGEAFTATAQCHHVENMDEDKGCIECIDQYIRMALVIFFSERGRRQWMMPEDLESPWHGAIGPLRGPSVLVQEPLSA